MNNRTIKVGIIGCGGIANGKHMPALKTIPGVEMVAFCDLIIEKAERARAQYGTPDAKVYTDYCELLADPSIEVIHVCTPNRSHAEISIASMQAGKHVMCEKPMAKCAADAGRMVEVSRETGKKLTIGYQHRQKTPSRYAKEYIDGGAVGDIYYANCYAIRRRGTPNWGVFLNEYEQGGGPLIDIATHSLDLTLYLMNNYEPAMVLGRTHKCIEHPEAGNIWGDNGVSTTPLEEAASALIVMKNGATILLETSWALNTDQPIEEGSCRLCGSRAGLSIINNQLKINQIHMDREFDSTVNLGAGGVAFYSGAEAAPHITEARRWIDSIRNDTDPTVLPEQAYVVSQILEAIYVSSKTGEAVRFE